MNLTLRNLPLELVTVHVEKLFSRIDSLVAAFDYASTSGRRQTILHKSHHHTLTSHETIGRPYNLSVNILL